MSERLEGKQVSDAQQSNLLIKLENDITRLFDITSQLTFMIKNHDRILNGSKETNKTLTEKVIIIKIIQIISMTVNTCIQTQTLKVNVWLLARCLTQVRKLKSALSFHLRRNRFYRNIKFKYGIQI